MMKAVAFAAVLNVLVGNLHANGTDTEKSLDEVKNLQIFGDFITITSKNLSQSKAQGSDTFDEYIRSHVVRIKVPLIRSKYFNFELSDLIPNEAKGRKKGKRLREILFPLLFAIKYKLSVLLPIFMAFVMGIALKGFWAGTMGLFISKLVALKVLLQSQNARDDEQDKDQNDYHEETDHHSYEILSQNTHEGGHEDNEQPVIIHLHSDGPGGKLFRRREDSPRIRQYYNPKRRDPWGKQQD